MDGWMKEMVKQTVIAILVDKVVTHLYTSSCLIEKSQPYSIIEQTTPF